MRSVAVRSNPIRLIQSTRISNTRSSIIFSYSGRCIGFLGALVPRPEQRLNAWPRSARPGSARNWPGSGRNKAARFENSLGPESSFVLGGPIWKQARFGLLPNHSGPDSIRISHPPDPIHPDGASFPTAREARATARQATARRLGWAQAASFSSAAFSPVLLGLQPHSDLQLSEYYQNTISYEHCVLLCLLDMPACLGSSRK
ncbi:uncharacterized protein LOC120701809 [Panicum virgatum]|uniref:uncharacterized protein LOC120701809 n=1 Tax=Panicum virgatum TaxID=38727 RepID=UPI0019D545A9|nr:uncharacterized protein LOC120701809 [Panicum virgatum]